MSEKKIVSADVGKMPKGMFDDMPVVTAKFDDGSEEKLFSYYPDEITFRPEEFVGLTVQEAKNLKGKKDRNYLKS